MAISWTRTYGVDENGQQFTGADLGNIQTDVRTQLHALLNANFSASAAIQEVKVKFNASGGHDHDGTDSRSIAYALKHYRHTLCVSEGGVNSVRISTGTIDIGGTILSTVANNTLAPATAGDWANGSEGASAWIYVYAYNNAGSLGYKFSDEPPDLSDTSDNAVEVPWRYQKYGSTYYRCIGAVFNNSSSNLMDNVESNFDLSPYMDGRLVATGADFTVRTIWTPKYVRVLSPVDATPLATEEFAGYTVTKHMIDDLSLNLEHSTTAGNTNHVYSVLTDDGSPDAIIAQAAGTAGGFTLDGITSGRLLFYQAWTDFHN